MDPLIIEGREETPLVHFDKEQKKFEISGNSYPEDSTAFYRPVIQWLNEYGKSPDPEISFTFGFVYFNSASYKSIYDILDLMKEWQNEKQVLISVKWIYKEGDSDIREIGEELAESTKIPFEIIATP